MKTIVFQNAAINDVVSEINDWCFTNYELRIFTIVIANSVKGGAVGTITYM